MLKVLNGLFSEGGDRVICKQLVGESLVTVAQLKADATFTYHQLIANKNTRWLLSSNDPYRFLVGLLAILASDKVAIISANRTDMWLNEISSSFDAILSDDLSLFKLDSKAKLKLKVGAPPLLDVEMQALFLFSGNELLQFFTSGSTGNAKKVKKRLIDITNEVSVLNQCFNEIPLPAHFLSSVSHFHIYGLLFNLILPLLSKRYWVNSMIEFQEQLAEYTDRCSEVVFISSPAFLSRLENKNLNFPINTIFSSGGPLQFLHAKETNLILGAYPIEVYGSTETGGIAYRQQLEGNTFWQTFEDVSLIEDERGIRLMSGHVSCDSPITLDDKIIINDDGTLSLLGRKDRIVKLEEKRISLNEIEGFLSKTALIKRCVALVIQGKRQVIGCVVELSSDGQLVIKSEGRNFLIRRLKSFMRSRFESVTIPRKWRFVDSLPVDSQGKLVSASLEKLF